MNRTSRSLKTVFMLLVATGLMGLGCSRAPHDADAPRLPNFPLFGVMFPEDVSISTQEGVVLAKGSIDLFNGILELINDMMTTAEGPSRVGLSFEWATQFMGGDYRIIGRIGSKGYDYSVVDAGTSEFELMNGSSDYYYTNYKFNIFDPASPEVKPSIPVTYSTDGGVKHINARMYGYDLGEALGHERAHLKIEILESTSGTGYIICHWDPAHIWDDATKYLELYWTDASTGTAEHGTWQTWDTTLPLVGSVTAGSGSW